MDIFNILLIIHITGGAISLLLGLYLLISKKGNSKHKLLGIIYFYSLLTASLVSMPMTYLHPSYFLFIIGVFTSYMLLTGKRYLKIKAISDVKLTDWILTFTMFVFGAAFIAFGFYNIVNSNYFGTVHLVFGSISFIFVYQDYVNYIGRSTVKNFGLITHLQRMIGSYIASATAFLVINNSILPGIVAWLLPTFLLVPLIIKWSAKFEIKRINKVKSNF